MSTVGGGRKRAHSEEPNRNSVKRRQREDKNDELAEIHEVIDISTQVPDCDLTNEDEDDIPYTHRSSRSASPLLLGSEDTKDVENNDSIVEIRKKPSKPSNNQEAAISVDDDNESDDDLREYFVITDDEVEDNANEDGNDTKTKTTADQLKNTHENCKNIKIAKCAICFDPPETTCILPCGHIYCADCVFRALSSSTSSTKTSGPCSLCRTKTFYKNIRLAILKKKKKSLVP